jgi:hypothetical protein
MSRRAQENLIAAVLLAGFLAIIVMSLEYSPRARLVPLPMAVLGTILVLVQLVWQNLRSVDELQVDVLELLTGQARDRGAAVGQRPGGAPGERGASKEAVAFAMLVALLAAFLLFGPVPAIFLFTAAYLILTRYCTWAKGLSYAAALTVIVVVVFGYILKIPLERSYLLPGIGQYIGL